MTTIALLVGFATADLGLVRASDLQHAPRWLAGIHPWHTPNVPVLVGKQDRRSWQDIRNEQVLR